MSKRSLQPLPQTSHSWYFGYGKTHECDVLESLSLFTQVGEEVLGNTLSLSKRLLMLFLIIYLVSKRWEMLLSLVITNFETQVDVAACVEVSAI